MFSRIGSFAARYRWPLLAAWVVAAILVTALAPNIDAVAVNDQRAFLSKDAPSLDAIAEMKRLFPGRVFASSAVVVFDAGGSGRVAAAENLAFIREVSAWASGDEAPPVIERVLSPAGDDEQTAQALRSADGQVALMVVNFNTIGTEEATHLALVDIEERLRQAPAGLETYVTGDAAIISAYDQATRESLDSTTWITIALVVLILLAVYRSPVSPLVPLTTITLAYLISRGAIAFLADGLITISGYTHIFLIVVLFGAGTDYCLFLISRFREEMTSAPAAHPAVQRTIRTVGETIASSAGTVVVGLSTMALAELGLFNTTGPSVAVGVVIALAAGLTLTPALLAILGARSFWPRRPHTLGQGHFWKWWARGVTARPKTALVVTLVVLLPLAIYGRGQNRDFDLLGDLPDEVPAHRGFDVLAEHMGPGVMLPVNVLVEAESFTSPAGLRHLAETEAQVANLSAVREVRGLTGSLADRGTLFVSGQLADRVQEVESARDALDLEGALDPASLQRAAGGLLDLFAYLQQLGREYPEVQQDADYLRAMGALATIGQAAGVSPVQLLSPGRTASPSSGGTTATPLSMGTVSPQLLRPAVSDLAAGLQGLRQDFSERPDALMLPGIYLESNEELRRLKEGYVSADGRGARLQVILDAAPYSPEALETVEDLRQLGAVEGSSAVVADLRDASARDMVRAIVWVLAGILLVLVLLLRSLVAPLYLILTILVSYGATLGIVRLVFSDLLGGAGITWWVPIFMFVMLVALGMDYNIFLMGRVKEEVAGAGDRRGTEVAVARTGGIITSAGIIMAGTFGAMMASSILGLVQLGFAVAVGVLLDTFVVRTALVPALVVLLGRWSWWPRRRR